MLGHARAQGLMIIVDCELPMGRTATIYVFSLSGKKIIIIKIILPQRACSVEINGK